MPEEVILDEVQRAPKMFASIKLTVDERKISGRVIYGTATIPFGDKFHAVPIRSLRETP